MGIDPNGVRAGRMTFQREPASRADSRQGGRKAYGHNQCLRPQPPGQFAATTVEGVSYRPIERECRADGRADHRSIFKPAGAYIHSRGSADDRVIATESGGIAYY